MKKLCSGCKIEKEETEFHKTKNTISGLRAQCKACSNLRGKQYRLAYIEHELARAKQYKKAHPEYGLKTKLNLYNITKEEYTALQEKQSNRCAICCKQSTKSLAIDHDHKTGKVRGLLCFSCNIILGHVKDNIELLEHAIQYIKKNGD